nr:hypothetical protein [Tanacetum cinerariifolium]
MMVEGSGRRGLIEMDQEWQEKLVAGDGGKTCQVNSSLNVEGDRGPGLKGFCWEMVVEGSGRRVLIEMDQEWQEKLVAGDGGKTALDMTILFEDPFKILEQTPFNLAYKSLDTTIDLARADWKETSMHHVISIDVLGIKRGDIKVEVEENRVLKVIEEKKADEETNGDKWHRAERISGKFCRQFKLPVNADMENITAQLEDGVLKTSVKKMAHERKQSKVIDIIEQGRSSDDVKSTKATA